jgi:LPXTG-motif cell wall-anchored protein
MKLLFSLSLALLGLAAPVRAEVQCQCDHVPIQPKECVNHCFAVLLSNSSSGEVESALGLDAQLRSDIAAIRAAGPIESISDLREQLPEHAFEQLESRIEAAASGRSQPAVLREQLASIGTVTYEAELTGNQIAALDDEEGREVAPRYGPDTGVAGDEGALPSTASGMPLLVLFGGISLAAGLALLVIRKQYSSSGTKEGAEHS